jgi:hypothetical protein
MSDQEADKPAIQLTSALTRLQLTNPAPATRLKIIGE